MSHTYATDAQTNSTNLATLISAATSLDQISAAITSIQHFLNKHSPDQSRWFFSLTFPTLISKLFGFEPPGIAWIDSVNTPGIDTEASRKLFDLVKTDSVLFNSVREVDKLNLVKYVFPVERLPEWVRSSLGSVNESVLSDISPLFRGRVKDRNGVCLELNILEYYLFWFAYYPVSKSSNETVSGTSGSGGGTSRRFRLENWGYKSLPGFGSSGKKGGEEKGKDGSGSLYVRVLRSYLKFFVPLSDLNGQSPYRSSLLHYSSSFGSQVLENAEFFVHTLINFWLVDNDFSPLDVKVCISFGVVLPLRSVLAEVPPTGGLGEVVNVFVKYLNLSLGLHSDGCDRVELGRSSKVRGAAVDMKYRDMFPGLGSVGYWNPCVQRPLYRYILRTFLFCPVDASVKNVSQVFSLWVNYMEPWVSSLDEFAEIDVNVDSLKKDPLKTVNVSQPLEYSSAWQSFVISNYLFYSSLVMHFIGFAHKFIHTDPEVIVQMVSKVVNILTSSRELVDLIKNVDTVFHSAPSGSSKSMLNTLYSFVPSIREQLQDWEDGLSETDADGSFLHENWNKDLKLFSTSEDGGQQLLQLLALRAESELQISCQENLRNNLQLLGSLKTQMGCLFGGILVRSPTMSEGRQFEKSHHEIFRPRTAGNRLTTDIRYKGDWMKRPISYDEIAWLANLLVKLSGWLNEILGLNPRQNGHVGPTTWSYVEIPGDTSSNVHGPKDTMRLVMGALCCWLITFGREAVKFMREHGIRVNLRMLASKKVVTVVLIVIALSAIKRMISNFHVV